MLCIWSSPKFCRFGKNPHHRTELVLSKLKALSDERVLNMTSLFDILEKHCRKIRNDVYRYFVVSSFFLSSPFNYLIFHGR